MAKRQIRSRVSRRYKKRSEYPSKGMLFIWFMLGGLIFLFAPQSLTSGLKFAYAHIFRWPLSIGRSITLSARTQPQFTEVVSRRKYDQLQNHLANITEELTRERQKVEELAKMRNRHPLEGAGLVLAEVITSSTEGFIINRGQDDGVQKGQFVIGDNSVIGTISAVSPRTAGVELITEAASNMAVQIEGLKTVIEGDGKDCAKARLISTKHKIKTGDNVYACKKPGFLDSPMIIGTVSRCKKNNENPLLLDITVKPACDIQKLTEVAVIIMNPAPAAGTGMNPQK